MSNYLEVSTVSVCKVGCKYCPQSLLYSRYGKKEYMTLDNFKVILSKLPKDVTIDFAGFVEPFLNEYTSDMILHITRHITSHATSVLQAPLQLVCCRHLT
jgi:uncharacterized Fe-S cluster-containing radical SAM superfamily enzyme